MRINILTIIIAIGDKPQLLLCMLLFILISGLLTTFDTAVKMGCIISLTIASIPAIINILHIFIL